MTSGDTILLGIGLIVFLGAICQVAAARLGLPSLIVLLPVGFLTGILTRDSNPVTLLGPGFEPVVSLSVAVILFRGGRDLDFSILKGPDAAVVRSLLVVGVPVTWAIATLSAMLLLGLQFSSALILGSMLVVSGPTVVGPLLDYVRPSGRLRRILIWEGTLVDPVGAMLALVVFHAITIRDHPSPVLYGGVEFLASVAIGIVGGAIGAAILWGIYRGRFSQPVQAAATFGTVILVAALCDIVQRDTGLLAAVLMGMAVTNLKAFEADDQMPFLDTVVALVIGVLFIAVPATIHASSILDVLAGSVALTAVLVLVQRPVVALLATRGKGLARSERAFIGWMAPRGIVAAATAAVLDPQLAAAGIPGAHHLLPITFLVVALTAIVYSSTARPIAVSLGVAGDLAGDGVGEEHPAVA